MKKFFTLIVSLGFLFISCGNAFQTKAQNGDTVDVSLNIPVEILASISSRSVAANARAASNSLEVSLFVNDEAPIKKSVTDFKKSVSISFPDIPVGSVVKATADLKYNGKEYSGESKSTIVTATGTELALTLKVKAGSNSNDTAGIALYFDDILLTTYPKEHDTTTQTIKTELLQMGFIETDDFTIQEDKIVLTESGLSKFLIVISEGEKEPAEVLLVYNKRMIGALSSKTAGLLQNVLAPSDYEITHNGMVLIVKSQRAIQEYYMLMGDDHDIFENEVSGLISINESKLLFNSFNDYSAEHDRYMSTISLEDILDGKHLSNDDTVAFVLKTSDEQPVDIFSTNSVSQFYYQLQIDDWQEVFVENDDIAGLFENNNCINFDIQSSNKYTFVMPLNLIKDPEDYSKLQLFFDCPKGTEAESFELKCSINYYIFPAAQNAFVFGVGTNYDDATKNVYPYRYELDLPLANIFGTMYTLNGKENVMAMITGTVNYYKPGDNISSQQLYTSTYAFHGEVYDRAQYTVAEGFKPANNEYYHPLSNDEEGNTKDLTVINGNFSGLDGYVFTNIQTPFYDADGSVSDFPSHNYRFQCYTPCYCPSESDCNPSVLLVIKDFNIIMTVSQ
ncbi:MAG: hypothetical protein J5687_05790 [Treponema sp.]|nr:hypothetical protein [Treponema sp.]